MPTLTGTETYNSRLSEEQVRLARIYVMQGPIGTLPQLAKRWANTPANAGES